MLKGIIILFDPGRRNGYVRLPDTREEFFFQMPTDEGSAGWSPGDWVTFRIEQDRRGYRAVDLQSLGTA